MKEHRSSKQEANKMHRNCLKTKPGNLTRPSNWKERTNDSFPKILSD